MEPSTPNPMQTDANQAFPKVARCIGVAGLIIGICISPPVFERVFAVAELSVHREIRWLGSALFTALCIAPALKRKHSPQMIGVIFSIQLLILAELSARLCLINAFPNATSNIAQLGDSTYIERARFTGHPFLHYVGKHRSTSLHPSQPLVINRFGFLGRNWTYHKKSDVIRVACLGGSTTASGYPAMLETFLNARVVDGDPTFEVLNFGIDGYTSVHSLINYQLNVRYFDPDFVVLHQGWNDLYAMVKSPMKTDYSHAFKPFLIAEPSFVTKWSLRTSVLVRYAYLRLGVKPDWGNLWEAMRRSPDPSDPDWVNAWEPFERNIATLMMIAQMESDVVILTTQPYSTDPEKKWAEDAPGISQANEIMRSLAKRSDGQALLVDLEPVLTGHNDLFTDVGHVRPAAKKIKARQIGNRIVQHLESKKRNRH